MSETAIVDTTQSKIDEIEQPDVLKSLSSRMVKFAEYYALSGVALQASRLAGYDVDSNKSYPYVLLEDSRIQTAIAYFREINAASTVYTPAKITAQWSSMASFNILDCCNSDYSLKNLDQLTADQREHLGKALVGLEVVEKNGKRFIKPKMAREQALIELGKLNRMYADDKAQGQGFELTINVGQQAIITQGTLQHTTEHGHLTINTEEE